FLPARSDNVKAAVNANNMVNSVATTVAQPDASSVISSTGASSLAYDHQLVSAEAGSKHYPLANIKFTIRGVKNETGGPGVIPSLSIDKNKTKVSLANDVAWSGLRTEQTLNTIKVSAPATVDIKASLMGNATTKTNVNVTSNL